MLHALLLALETAVQHTVLNAIPETGCARLAGMAEVLSLPLVGAVGTVGTLGRQEPSGWDHKPGFVHSFLLSAVWFTVPKHTRRSLSLSWRHVCFTSVARLLDCVLCDLLLLAPLLRGSVQMFGHASSVEYCAVASTVSPFLQECF